MDNMTKPILTIAIPTFNRANFLEKNLNLLAQQQHESTAILVSDNDSTDDTHKVVERFKKVIPNLTYHRNEENIGFDGNIIKLYELSRTPYIWFLSDDDPIEAGAVKAVVGALRQYKPTVALFRNSHMDELTGTKKMPGRRDQKLRVFEDFDGDDSYIALLSTMFISVLVVQKNPDISPKDLDQYSGYGDIHMTLSLLLLEKKFRFCLFDSVIVLHRQGRVYHNDLVSHCITNVFCAVNLPELGLDIERLKQLIFSRGYRCMGKIVLSTKLGRDVVTVPTKPRRMRDLYSLFGISSLWGISFLIACLLSPAPIVKLLYLSRYIYRFGLKQGIEVFRNAQVTQKL